MHFTLMYMLGGGRNVNQTSGKNLKSERKEIDSGPYSMPARLATLRRAIGSDLEFHVSLLWK